MRYLPACLLMLVLSSPAAAGSQKAEAGTQTPPAAAAADGAAAAEDPNREVCKIIYPTGSRVKGVKDCRTAAQWADIERNSREMLDKHTQRAKLPSSQ
ncbi:MAG TPA: hypothetical protein VED40_22260 [Azospirillaceae bacterium]|nr:hypothetical protein [Azospirillaceae bacterium]